MWSVIVLVWLGISVVSCFALFSACIMSGTIEAKIEKTRLINQLQMQQIAAMQHVGEVVHTA